LTEKNFIKTDVGVPAEGGGISLSLVSSSPQRIASL